MERRSGLPTRDVLVTWGKAADAFLAYAGLLSEDDWEKQRFPWLAGEIAARYLVQSRVVEWWIHGEDMRATNGLGPEYQHWPIYMTIDMGVRMLPWALGQAGLDLTGYSVQIDVEGAGEGSWHWGLGAGEVPPADKEPDATIVGRAPQLALVAARRRLRRGRARVRQPRRRSRRGARRRRPAPHPRLRLREPGRVPLRTPCVSRGHVHAEMSKRARRRPAPDAVLRRTGSEARPTPSIGGSRAGSTGSGS